MLNEDLVDVVLEHLVMDIRIPAACVVDLLETRHGVVVLTRLSPTVKLHLLRLMHHGLLVHHVLLMHHRLLHGHHGLHMRMRRLHVRMGRLHVRVGWLIDRSMTCLLLLLLSWDDDDWIGRNLLVLGMSVEEYNFYDKSRAFHQLK